jgi:hypothetical protein
MRPEGGGAFDVSSEMTDAVIAAEFFPSISENWPRCT